MPVNRNRLTAVYLAFTSSSLGFSLWYSLFPIYLRKFGFEVWQIGFIFSILNLATSISYLTLASFSETMGRERALIIGFSFSAIILLTLALVKSSAFIIVLVVLYNILGGLKTPVGEAIIADTGRSLGLSLSIFYLATTMASVVGSALSGYIVASLGFSTIFTLAGVLTALSAISITFTYGYLSNTNFKVVRRTFIRSFENAKLIFSDGNIRKLSIALVFHSLGFSIINPLVQLYAKEALNLNEQSIGVVMAMWNAGLLVAQIPSGEFTDRFGGINVLSMHIILSSVSWIFYCLSKTWSEAIFSAFILGVVGALDMPARRTIIVQFKKAIDSASIIGYLDALTNLVFIVGSSLGGIIWNTLGYNMPFIIGSIINVFALIPLVTLISSKKRFSSM